ncbi:MAG: ATP-dependent 6-phosphofructokinase [Thermoplasmata archaeon]
MVKRVAVLTGGGDCPGLNNAIKWVTNAALDDALAEARGERYEVEGINYGWRGAIEFALKSADCRDCITPLDKEFVRKIDRDGGTILGSSRTNPFKYKESPSSEPVNVSEKVLRALSERYHAVVAIGGEDTLGVAARLHKMGLNVVGIPKTIDKDLGGTDITLGFDSAVNYIKEAMTRLVYTAGSHNMNFFVEIMGRHTGHLAFHGGMAGGAHFILVPECEVDMEALFDKIVRRKESGRRGERYTIVAVAEGTRLRGVGEIKQGKRDAFGHTYLGGVALFLRHKFEEYVNKKYEARELVLGHLQRGGTPSTFDMILGRLFGIKAIGLVDEGRFGRMASLKDNRVTDAPLDEAARTNYLDWKRCYDERNFTPKLIADTMYFNTT